MNKLKIITNDGSPSIYLKDINEYYHSKHGAVSESKHVFIKNGLKFWKKNSPNNSSCNIFEMGFGTGLNSILTYEFSIKNKLKINYQTIESNPLIPNEIKFLDYSKFFKNEKTELIFKKLHSKSWEEIHSFDKNFYFLKMNKKIQNFNFNSKYDIIYYDAFGSRVQPELWKENIFRPIIRSLNNFGVFVTYSSMGNLRRSLIKLGMNVEKIDGPIGKREMIRAIKI